MHPAQFNRRTGKSLGKNEYGVAGGRIGEPIEVIAGPRTGLAIPSHVEIAFEGFIHPGDVRDEDPLGEWTGYKGGVAPGSRKDRTSPFVAAARERPSTLASSQCWPVGSDVIESEPPRARASPGKACVAQRQQAA
jgi:hypothetical protein